MLMSSFLSQLFLSVVLFCVVVVFSAYPEEDNDSAIYFEYPHHPQTVRDIDSRITPDGGRKCHSESMQGKCVEILECPPAIKSVHIHKKHNFKRCGFHGNIEVICCPNEFISEPFTMPSVKPKNSSGLSTGKEPEQHSRLNNRKSVQVCEEYSKKIQIDVTFHIVDGENAEPREFPHMVALGYNSDTIGVLKWDCGGSLISNRFVLTAAHCIINADQNSPVKAKMGMVKLNESLRTDENIQQFDIVNITIHPNYKRWEKLNDIALIKLDKDVINTNYVHPACLYSKDEEPLNMIVSGWGTTETAGENSNILQKAKLTAVSLQNCNVTYLERTNKNILRTQICAADNKSDTCQGDSGGPLQVQNIANSSVYSIVGVTSYGIGCASKYPGIYTRVSSYLDWIENTVWGNS